MKSTLQVLAAHLAEGDSRRAKVLLQAFGFSLYTPADSPKHMAQLG